MRPASPTSATAPGAGITVEKVPGEQNIDNNIGVYQIQFRLKPA